MNPLLVAAVLFAVDPMPAAPSAPPIVTAPEELPTLDPSPIPGANFRLEAMSKQNVVFKVHHPFKTSVGVTHGLVGAGRVLDDGTVQVMVRVPMDSLDTGNASQNENAAAVLQPHVFPTATVRAFVRPAIPVPAGWINPDDTLEVATDSTATLQLTLHGVTKIFEQVPIHLVYEPHGRVRVVGSFPIDLTAFNVPLPRFFFVQIERSVDLQFDLLWQPELAAK